VETQYGPHTQHISRHPNQREILIWGFPAPALFCDFNPMNANCRHRNALEKNFGAYLCLLAVILLWAPAWAAAFQAAQMACCTTGMCPLHGHVPKRSSGDESGRKHTQTSECSHRQCQAAMDCNAACCHPSDPTVTSALVFVLPAAQQITAPLLSGRGAVAKLPRAGSLRYRPPSPPPRS
jgi:hypothetical protein